jgi:hypothetical protein
MNRPLALIAIMLALAMIGCGSTRTITVTSTTSSTAVIGHVKRPARAYKPATQTSEPKESPSAILRRDGELERERLAREHEDGPGPSPYEIEKRGAEMAHEGEQP